jgi:hypothetical protein
MSEPRLEDDIALGLDEICEDCDNGTDQRCRVCSSSDFDTLEEKDGV